MPITTKQVKRYRGKQRILLRKILALNDQIQNNQTKYAEPPTPNRNHLPNEIATSSNVMATSALAALDEMWPPQTG